MSEVARHDDRIPSADPLEGPAADGSLRASRRAERCSAWVRRYVLKVPKDAKGHDIYSLSDIKAMQDWVLEREFRRVQRIVDVTSFGGTVRRYEVQPDPDRLRRYGITLGQLEATLTEKRRRLTLANRDHTGFAFRAKGRDAKPARPCKRRSGNVSSIRQ